MCSTLTVWTLSDAPRSDAHVLILDRDVTLHPYASAPSTGNDGVNHLSGP
jgi:hypothetical protein